MSFKKKKNKRKKMLKGLLLTLSSGEEGPGVEGGGKGKSIVFRQTRIRTGTILSGLHEIFNN